MNELLDKLKKQQKLDCKLGKEICNDFAEYKLNHKELTLLLEHIENLQSKIESFQEDVEYWKEKGWITEYRNVSCRCF